MLVLACAEAEQLEDEDARDTGEGGALPGFGGTYAAGKSGLANGGAPLNRGGAAGGKANSGGVTLAGGTTSRGGSSTDVPAEGGQADSVTSGSPTCRFVDGDGGASGAGGAGGGLGGADSGSGGTGDDGPTGIAGGIPASGAGGASSDPVTSVPSPFAFCDDFDDGDAGGWRPDSCSWSVASDESLAYESGGGACLSSAGAGAWTDQVLEAQVKVIQFGGTSNSYRAGLFARYGGSSNYYTLALAGNGSVRLLRGTSVLSGSGQCSDLDANITTNTWYTLRLEVTGAMNAVRVRGYLNGALSHDCSVTNNPQLSGGAGVITTGSSTLARFDDFRVSLP